MAGQNRHVGLLKTGMWEMLRKAFCFGFFVPASLWFFSPNWAIPAGYLCFITINSFLLLWGVFFFMQRTLRILIFFNAKTFMWPKCRQVHFLLWFNCNFFSWRIFVSSFPLCAEFEEWVLLINLLFCILISSSFILRDFFGMCLDHEFKLSYKTLRVWFCLL